ncbi:cell envelope biogenesis protein TolA (plasmid) [Bradyrhizobium barranii subsp. barranii]|uniref:Cell envelope biogenesis protein TolA n=1 Tax=Bradyrhizobium barranii subsp. barranii TaxID=2823807 RepID=A0A939MKW0_9BRAD|nr:cell envelope biogenesis protein TolA [Bradyrhizobium barranii]UEM18073.1 cell envelope biogenesis protein TolA [Bradyrhizobium barranii subsp. barranii]
MARKLKTYQTSLGFFEQAIAAPSMKAALEAWGADSNLFHQGAAKESTDPDVIAATMKKPGIVLKRPVGSDGPFGEHAELPKSFGRDGTGKPPSKKVRAAKKTSAKSDKAAERKADQAYERERQRREREEAKEEAARRKERERRERVVEKAQSALDEAEREHAKRASALRSELEVVEDRIRSEADDWAEEEKRLKAALKRARDGRT